MLWAHNKIRLLVTGVCNAHCPHCHNEGLRSAVPHMPLELAEHIVRFAETAGEPIRSATISGGEALLHPHVSSIVELLRKVSPKLTLSTNALCLSAGQTKDLVRAGVTKFRIDVDPYRMVGSRWNQAGLEYERLALACSVVTQSGASVELNSVLTAYTLRQLVDLIEFCVLHRINIKFFQRVLRIAESRLYPAPDTPRELLEEAITLAPVSFTATSHDGTGDRIYTGAGLGLRYCEFLCTYGRCALSGTRFDPEGYVSTCMNSPQCAQISFHDPDRIVRARIAQVVARGCESEFRPRKVE